MISKAQLFLAVHGVLKARILKWFDIPFSSVPHFVRPLHHDPSEAEEREKDREAGTKIRPRSMMLSWSLLEVK